MYFKSKMSVHDFLFLRERRVIITKYKTQGHLTTRQKKDAEFFPVL